jgi:hypothetical protein
MPRLPRIVRIAFFSAMLVGLLGSCGISCPCGVDVRNNTPYHLHYLGQNESHLYVPPGEIRSMTFETDEDPEMKIIIAPAQDQSGRITIPNACDFSQCQFIDVWWSDPPGVFSIEWAGCRYEPNTWADAGG